MKYFPRLGNLQFIFYAKVTRGSQILHEAGKGGVLTLFYAIVS